MSLRRRLILAMLVTVLLTWTGWMMGWRTAGLALSACLLVQAANVLRLHDRVGDGELRLVALGMIMTLGPILVSATMPSTTGGVSGYLAIGLSVAIGLVGITCLISGAASLASEGLKRLTGRRSPRP
jgi:hypothetical protein